MVEAMSGVSEPLVSVIVPNYNNSQYLAECLDSILSQTYKNIELIVADDCSTDDSRHIIESYEKKYANVKGIYQAVNVGVTENRMRAIHEATGIYITTIDSDDYYYRKDKIKKEKILIDKYAKDGIEIVAFSNSALVKPDGEFIGLRGNSDNLREGDLMVGVITRSCKIPYNFLIKKDQFFEAGGYDAKVPLYEDWDLKIRLASLYEFHYTGVVGNAIRLHGKGLSSTSLSRHIYWMHKVFWKNYSRVKAGARREVILDVYLMLYRIFYNQAKRKIMGFLG